MTFSQAAMKQHRLSTCPLGCEALFAADGVSLKQVASSKKMLTTLHQQKMSLQSALHPKNSTRSPKLKLTKFFKTWVVCGPFHS